MITQAGLKKILRYDEQLGRFFWIITLSNRASAGSIAGAIVKSHRIIRVLGKRYQEHDLVWLYMTGEWPVQRLDHKDRDGLNNKYDNLRYATRQENARNCGMRSHNTSGYKGVRFHKRDHKYEAYITINGQFISLGYFYTAELAAERRAKAVAANFGEFVGAER